MSTLGERLKALLPVPDAEPEPEPSKPEEEGFGPRPLPSDPSTIEYWLARGQGGDLDLMPPSLREAHWRALAKRGERGAPRRPGNAAKK